MIAIKKFLRRHVEATNGLVNALDNLRDRIVVLADEQQAVEAWPVPYEEAVASLEKWIDSIDFRNFIPVATFTSGSEREWPRLSDSAAGLMAMALLTASARGKVRDTLAAELRIYYEGRASGTASDRARRLREIEGELAELERQEEKIIREAEAAGLPILRRENASPAVVLAADEDL